MTAATIDPLESGSDDEGRQARIRAAADGDQRAWNELVRRYSSLITSVARRYRLDPDSIDDVRQVVWMRCYTHLAELRDPAALPGWLRTMAHREALRMANSRRRFTVMDPADLERTLTGGDSAEDPSGGVLRSEAGQAVRDALAELTPEQRRLLIILHSETGLSYQEVSQVLGMPTGSIGPTKARCLVKLRRTAALARYLNCPAESA